MPSSNVGRGITQAITDLFAEIFKSFASCFQRRQVIWSSDEHTLGFRGTSQDPKFVNLHRQWDPTRSEGVETKAAQKTRSGDDMQAPWRSSNLLDWKVFQSTQKVFQHSVDGWVVDQDLARKHKLNPMCALASRIT